MWSTAYATYILGFKPTHTVKIQLRTIKPICWLSVYRLVCEEVNLNATFIVVILNLLRKQFLLRLPYTILTRIGFLQHIKIGLRANPCLIWCDLMYLSAFFWMLGHVFFLGAWNEKYKYELTHWHWQRWINPRLFPLSSLHNSITWRCRNIRRSAGVVVGLVCNTNRNTDRVVKTSSHIVVLLVSGPVS